MNRTGRAIGGRRRLAGIAGFLVTTALTVFHGRLLWQRLADGSLLQPIVIARWGLSVLLVAALLQLWSRGLPLLRGRRAAVLWLVVVLLHAMAPVASLPAVAPAVGSMLPAAMAALALLAVGLITGTRPGATALARVAARRRRPPSRSSAGWSRALFSRPPPVSLHP